MMICLQTCVLLLCPRILNQKSGIMVNTCHSAYEPIFRSGKSLVCGGCCYAPFHQFWNYFLRLLQRWWRSIHRRNHEAFTFDHCCRFNITAIYTKSYNAIWSDFPRRTLELSISATGKWNETHMRQYHSISYRKNLIIFVCSYREYFGYNLNTICLFLACFKSIRP